MKHLQPLAQRGFTLLEIIMVLVVIGLILGAVSIGSNMQRAASYQRMASTFVNAWVAAYQAHFNNRGYVVGDIQDGSGNWTLKVNGSNAPTPYCGADLRSAMIAAGVSLPPGRATGFEDRYGYLDSNGNPQDAQVCFAHVAWSVINPAGTYEVKTKNVMILDRLTPDLARMLDNMIDGSQDARFGSFRESTLANSTATTSSDWSIDNRTAWDGRAASDDSQVKTVKAYYLMNP
ncbi:MAG: type II secretion system protein [Methylococcales bacterium]|nr:type II secretion system protein [Methylococcales bacterium]